MSPVVEGARELFPSAKLTARKSSTLRSVVYGRWSKGFAQQLGGPGRGGERQQQNHPVSDVATVEASFALRA
jgi:hypothetical protein